MKIRLILTRLLKKYEIEHNLKWRRTTEDSYATLIIGGSRSGKTDALQNLKYQINKNK